MKLQYKDLINIFRNSNVDDAYMRSLKNNVLNNVHRNSEMQIMLYLVLGGIKKEYELDMLEFARAFHHNRYELNINNHLADSIYYLTYWISLKNKSETILQYKTLIRTAFDETIVPMILDEQIIPVHLKLYRLLIDKLSINL